MHGNLGDGLEDRKAEPTRQPPKVLRIVQDFDRAPLGRPVDLLPTMRFKSPHRQILRASYSGRNQGVQLLASVTSD